MTRSLQWRIALGVVVIFLAGAATGLFAGVWHAHHTFVLRHGGRPGEGMRAHLQHALQLTPEQEKALRPAFDQMTAQLQDIRADSGRRVAETMAQVQRDIAPQLTPEQKARLTKMENRHRRMLRAGGGGFPQRPPPPPDDRP